MKKTEIISRLIEQIYQMTDIHKNQLDELLKENQKLKNKIYDFEIMPIKIVKEDK